MLPLLLAAALAQPPTDRPFEARPRRHWDVTDLALDVTVDPAARTVAGRAVHRIAPLVLPSDTLRLHQVALDIAEVRVDGEPVVPRLGPGFLDVPVAPGAPHVVEVTWRATPATGVHFRDADGRLGAVEAWTQNEMEDARYWFPAWDHPSDTFPVAVTLTVPDGLHAVANGALVGREAAEPGWTRWRYRLEQPIVTYLVAFAVGDHAVWRDEGPVPLEYVVPRGVPEDVARRTLDEVQPMMPWLADLLGEPYPYPVYRQVVVQRFLYGGMENASLTVLDDDYLAGPHDVARHQASRVVAHELAHQWFGDLLTTHGWRELWLNEGFATFYAARWAEHLHGDEEYAAQVRGWAAPAAATRQPMAARAWSQPGAEPYHAQYVRGATVLHMLRAWLGDAAFDAAIRRYVAEHRFSLVETADLRQAFEAVTGNDLRWFFDRWVHGWGAPSLTTRWSEADGRLRVSWTQAAAPERASPPGSVAPPYEGPLRVDWADASGVHTEDLWLAPGSSHLEVPADGVRWVAVDPVGGVLAHWTREQATGAWAAQLAEAPTAHARLVAAEALGAVDDARDVAIAALRTALFGGHRPARPDDAPYDTQRLAVQAARSLGALATPEGRDVLIEGLARPDASPSLRAAIATALGRHALDAPAAAALTALVQRDPIPAVAGSALVALGEAWPSKAPPLAERALRRRDPSSQGDLHTAALGVLGRAHDAERVDPGALATVLGFTDDPRRNVQHAAGAAAVRLARHEDVRDATRARVARALAPWLDHEDRRTRDAALLHLAALGSPEALPHLLAFAARTTLPAHRDAARAAILALRSGAGATPVEADALARAHATLEALQERVDELEERLQRVESW